MEPIYIKNVECRLCRVTDCRAATAGTCFGKGCAAVVGGFGQIGMLSIIIIIINTIIIIIVSKKQIFKSGKFLLAELSF